MIKEVTQYIENKTALKIGVNLFVGPGRTDAPDEAVMVMETAPGIANVLMRDIRQTPIQVLSRAKTYLKARNNAYAVHDILHGIIGVTLPIVDKGAAYLVNVCDGRTPFYIGTDEKLNHTFSANYMFRVQE